MRCSSVQSDVEFAPPQLTVQHVHRDGGRPGVGRVAQVQPRVRGTRLCDDQGADRGTTTRSRLGVRHTDAVAGSHHAAKVRQRGKRGRGRLRRRQSGLGRGRRLLQ